MNKEIIKEIFLLALDVIKALCGLIWKKIKCLVWDRFFATSVSSHEKAMEQEWGVTGEDKWPSTPEAPSGEQKESQQRTERKESVYIPIPTTPELPDNYGDNRIVLMVRDPLWLFAYWEIRKDVLDRVRSALGVLAHNTKIVLRVYNVTDIIFNGSNAHKCFDIEVTGGARDWYIEVGEPNRSFCVDIGFLSPNGTFRVLARSNTVRMPRMSISEVVDEEWMSIGELYEKVYVPMGRGVSESAFERAHGNWQEALKEDVSSPGSLDSSSVSKK